MKSSFIIVIKYQDRILQYESKKCDLIIEQDNYLNQKNIKERAIKILKEDRWNVEEFLDVSKK